MKTDLLLIYRFFHTFLMTQCVSMFICSMERDITWGFYGKSLCLVIPVAGLYMITRKFRGIVWFVLAGALSLGVMWVIPGSKWERLALVFGAAVLVFSYFLERLGGENSWMVKPAYPCLFVFIGLYIFSVIYHRSFMGQILCVYTGCYWILCVLSENRRALLQFYEQNRRLHRFPKERIAAGNRAALGAVCGMGILGMLLFPVSGIDRGILLLWQFIKNQIAKVLQGGEEILPEQEMVGTTNEFAFLPQEQGEIPPFLMAFFKILETVTEILAIAVLIGALVYLVYKIYRKYHSTVFDDGDKVEFLDRSREKEKKTSVKKREGRLFRFGRRSPEEMIRRHYRKIILVKGTGKPQKSMSPRELETAAGLSPSAEREEFHALYEKARYGHVSCTQEESVRMRKLMK